MSSPLVLIKITAQIYKKVLFSSFLQCLSGWRIVFFHFLGLIFLGIFYSIVKSPDLVSSIIRGLVTSYFVSLYLSTVRGVVRRDSFSFRHVFHEALDIFSPILSIYFFLMLIGFVLKALNNSFIFLAFSVLFSVLANPILEILYLRGGAALEMLGESIEFVKENFIEWFMPIIIIGVLLLGARPQVLLSLFSESPLYQIESTILFFSVLSLNMGLWVYVIPALYLFLYIMVCRGSLYLELEKGRRSRIYRARMGE